MAFFSTLQFDNIGGNTPLKLFQRNLSYDSSMPMSISPTTPTSQYPRNYRGSALFRFVHNLIWIVVVCNSFCFVFPFPFAETQTVQIHLFRLIRPIKLIIHYFMDFQADQIHRKVAITAPIHQIIMSTTPAYSIWW